MRIRKPRTFILRTRSLLWGIRILALVRRAVRRCSRGVVKAQSTRPLEAFPEFFQYIIVSFRSVRNHAAAAILVAAFKSRESSAALVQEVQRAKAEQAVELFRSAGLVAGKIAAVRIADEAVRWFGPGHGASLGWNALHGLKKDEAFSPGDEIRRKNPMPVSGSLLPGLLPKLSGAA